MLFYLGPGGWGGPDATLYTEDTPRRERKEKKKASHLRACVVLKFFVHAYGWPGSGNSASL